MGYSTPHEAREYLVAAALRVCHEYVLWCQRRSHADKRAYLREVNEIALCARVADYFGSTARIYAQGVSKIDIEVAGPTISAEVKYFRPPARSWASLQRDWNWLLGLSNTNQDFRKRAWLVFWPSSASGMFTFTNCLSVTRGHGAQYSLSDFAPFSPYAQPAMPNQGLNQKLEFKQPSPVTILEIPGGKAVRVDIVGATTHPIWCAVYTRVVGPHAGQAPAPATIQLNDAPIAIP